MPKYSIAFVVPDEKNQLRHRIVEGANEEDALRDFFKSEIQDLYSNDEQGFHYFKEDFYDTSTGSGSLIRHES